MDGNRSNELEEEKVLRTGILTGFGYSVKYTAGGWLEGQFKTQSKKSSDLELKQEVLKE